MPRASYRYQQPCRLVVAGAGPVAEEVGRRIATMGLSDLVDLRGYITGDDLLSAYRDADLFVLPSYREGFPLVVMEAMDHGLPVVTTPIRGCADHLQPGVNALFTPPRDAESLAAVLLRLLGDKDLRERMGAANQRKVREFATYKGPAALCGDLAWRRNRSRWSAMIRTVEVLAARLQPIGVDEASSMIAAWTSDSRGRAVCAANVHMVMEAWDDPAFGATLREADLAVCDGRPLVWACRLAGVRDAQQARGLDLLHAVCGRAARLGLAVGLYGGTEAVNATVGRRLVAAHPGLRIVYAWSPPFRDLSPQEDAAAVADIAAAGVQILFVGLGCPKQEKWMLAHRKDLTCVALGLGAAFDMVAGDLRIAPRWMQRLGLEWAFRLAIEPRRLWRRYARHNTRFLVLLAREQLARRSGDRQGPPPR